MGLAEIIIAILSSTAITELVRRIWVTYFAPKISARENIEAGADIQDRLRRALADTRARSLVVYETANGPRLVDAASPTYLTCIFEAVEKPAHSIVRAWDQRRVDPDFKCLLRPLVDDEYGCHAIDVAKIRSTVKREQLQRLDAASVAMVRIPSSPRVVRFLVARFPVPADQIESDERDRLRALASYIHARLRGQEPEE